MYHFFVDPCQIQGDTACITGKDVNHISNVLRMKPGEKLLISAGEDWDYLCEIRAILRDEIHLSVCEENRDVRELPVAITLYQGLPKADKMEFIIQKAVELGARRIVPVETKRCIVKLDRKKAEQRRARWQMIAESAAKQSGRRFIPLISPILAFEDALKEAKEDAIKLIPYECEKGMEKTKRAILGLMEGDKVSVFIGPEGGFEEREIETAKQCGFTPISLGRRILRTETAGIALLSHMMLSLEEMGD